MHRYFLASLALSACPTAPEDDIRRPCPGAPAWDPNAPLALRWSEGGKVALNEHVARRLRVFDEQGAEIAGRPFAFPGGLGLCVIGGLPADADLTWDFTPGAAVRVQEWDTVSSAHTGIWEFHTAASSELAAPTSVEACENQALNELYDTQCPRYLPDSGDTGPQ